MSSPSGVSDETRSQGLSARLFAICGWHSTFRYRVLRAPHWTIAGWLIDSNESSAQRPIFVWDGSSLSMLPISGAAKATVSFGLIGRAMTCKTG